MSCYEVGDSINLLLGVASDIYILNLNFLIFFEFSSFAVGNLFL